MSLKSLVKDHLPPLKSIREKCLDCCAGSRKEVAICHISDCTLHPYRFGKNPKREGAGNKRLRTQKA